MNFNASFGSAVHTHPAVPGRLDVDLLHGGAEADLMRSSIVTVELNESADAYVEGLYEKAEEDFQNLQKKQQSLYNQKSDETLWINPKNIYRIQFYVDAFSSF